MNSLDLNSMIFIFEPATEDSYRPFSDTDDNGVPQPYGIMIADKQMRVYEMSRQCKAICKLS